jgi:hypothetical protein
MVATASGPNSAVIFITLVPRDGRQVVQLFCCGTGARSPSYSAVERGAVTTYRSYDGIKTVPLT